MLVFLVRNYYCKKTHPKQMRILLLSSSGERNESSLTGYQKASKCEGSATMFYDIPGEIDRLLHHRNYFRMKIRHGDRSKIVASSRLMMTDLALCPRNPAHPGPANFYPQNYCLNV